MKEENEDPVLLETQREEEVTVNKNLVNGQEEAESEIFVLTVSETGTKGREANTYESSVHW